MTPSARSTGPAQVGSGTPAILDRLLQESSRTFALTIPLLPEPTRHEVTVAYLLFRVADTLEDATRWSRERKLSELAAFEHFLDRPTAAGSERLAARWIADPPLGHEGYLELLHALPALTDSASTLSDEAWLQIAMHTRRTTRAMGEFVAREEDGRLQLAGIADLRAYCYAVAGIVGEMLTELFLLGRHELTVEADALRRDAPSFGEALQLVNILKDSADDAAEGRFFLPAGVPRGDVLALARRDLAIAGGYCARLERLGAERGLVAFTALPTLLASATLDRVAAHGPGAKITREELAAIVARLTSALDEGSVSPLLAGL